MNITESLIDFLYIPLGIIILIIMYNIFTDTSHKNNNLRNNFWKKNMNNWIKIRGTQ